MVSPPLSWCCVDCAAACWNQVLRDVELPVDEGSEALPVFLVLGGEPFDVLPQILQSSSVPSDDEAVRADEKDDEQPFDNAERFDERNGLVPCDVVIHE